MKVIGAGFARTGTMTMCVALEQFGFRSYHMAEVGLNFRRGDMRMWNDYLEGRRPMDWHKLLAGYDATTDFPACLYYRELMEAFPDAKVILNVRDPDAWWKSMEKLVHVHNTLVERLTFMPRFRAFQRLFRNIERVAFGGPMQRENSISRFITHNEEVKATVPADRLLVYSVSEGWGPLCEFLNVPVPDSPFPHLNAGVETVEKIMRDTFVRDLLIYAVSAAVVVVLAILLIKLLTN